MKRRTAIRNIVLLSAGAAMLNACQDKASVVLKSIPLTGSEEELLATLTETIIPTTDFIGAKDLRSHEFTLVMVDECGNPEDQDKFLKGMKAFDEACRQKFNSGFADLEPGQRSEYLHGIESASEGLPEEAIGFYKAVKRYTIQSFTTSEQYLTQVRKFSLIPAPFKGCVPVVNA